jgi:hypothetical protein
MVVLAVTLPEVPVTVTVYVPGVVVPAAVRVITLLPVVVGLGENAAVAPLGRPEAAIVTLPENPSSAVTVTVTGTLPY